MTFTRVNGTGSEGSWNLERHQRNASVGRFWRKSGLLIRRPILKGVLTFPLFAKEEDWYAFVFVAYDAEGDLIDSSEGNLRWIEDEHLLDLELWEGDRYFLPLLAQPGVFSGKFVYRNGALVDYSLIRYD